jgi:SAM-dependent methyltransferase
MKAVREIGLPDVQKVYSGREGLLWELLMGEQIHIGGFSSSMDLAERAGIKGGEKGIDLCCATGAGMRFLVRYRGVATTTGVDATEKMVQLGRHRVEEEGLAHKISFLNEDVCRTSLPGAEADFVWGEDAWCYVEDKAGLIDEAVRIVKRGGRIAFTDWVEGPGGLSEADANRFLTFMKFPSVLTLSDYTKLLEDRGCSVAIALDTGRFASHARLYIDMIEKQLTYDALKIIDFDTAMAGTLLDEMKFMETLAKTGKICQGLVVAFKTP